MEKLHDIGYIMGNTAISDTGEERYKLSALMDENGLYCMPSLELSGLRDKLSTDELNEKELETYWDADTFLIEILHPALIVYLNSKEVRDGEGFAWIIKHIPIEDFKLVRDLIEQGIRLGFFREYYIKKSNEQE